jgi:outer membrane protein assembly factor BamB
MRRVVRLAVAASITWGCTCQAGRAAEPAQARQILEAAGIHGGLIVHLHCGDGKLTAALHAGDGFLVHGLDADVKNVEAARKHIRSLGLYGKVSVEHWTGNRLPYVDNLVNLLVAEDLGGAASAEVMRVLSPLGVAYLRGKNGAWTKTVKPWPADIDQWQQYLHDADNNAVAHDSTVGPPRHLQWVAEPQWSRSHLGLASVTSMVSSQGRLFGIEDQGSAEHPALPGKFALVARDAFNGVLLWQHSFPDWEPVTRHIKSTPVQLQRRLAAIGHTVYCTPGFSAPVTALDAATGRIIRSYEGTERTQEFAFDRGVLYLVVGDRMNSYGEGKEYRDFGGSGFSPAAYGQEALNLPDPKCSLVALQADSGRRLWEKSGSDTQGYQACSLAIRGQCAAYCTAEAVVCLDRTTGRQMWRVREKVSMPKGDRNTSGAGPTLVISENAVYVADAKTLMAYALQDGKKMWAGTSQLNYHKPPDVFLAAGAVWTGRTAGLEGYDPQTGKVLKTIPQAMTGPMGHDRCYRNRITDHFCINTKTGGSDFLRLDIGQEFPNPWVRGTCGMGVLPCNGLLYAPPPACSCCNWVMLNALNALAPEPGLKSSAQPIQVETTARLEKGPAYAVASNPQSPIPNPSDWPTYRHDAGRSGITKARVPAELKRHWEARLTTRASAPVIAAGKVFAADIDAHTICALDASDGHVIWSYTTGGRVDSPPTYYQGLLLFGSSDGWVYCLRASDGALAWRFRDLPADRLICAYGQLESAWPVSGSILVKDDVAYFAAGRNSFLDGGIFLYGLDPQTGRVIYQRRMYGPYDAEGHPIITRIAGGSEIEGFKADVFLTDGQLLYLRQQAFKPDLSPLGPEEVTRPHLIPSAGFLEAIPHHRTFWTIDTTIRYDLSVPQGNNPHGDLLVMDGSRFYEVRGYPPGRTYTFDPRPNGYTLFAGVYARPVKAETVTTGKNSKKKISRSSSERWSCGVPLTGKAMALAANVLFVAGTAVAFPAEDLHQAYEGRMGGVLWAASAETGKKMAEYKLDAAPVWDGMAAADGRLFISTMDGKVLCLGDAK